MKISFLLSILFLTGFLFLNCTDSENASEPIQAEREQEEPGSKTTIYLVRHGETDGPSSGNPDLSDTGRARAERLTKEIGRRVDAVYSTDFPRTRQTAAPTAEAYGLTVRSYDVGDLRGVVDRILQQHRNGHVLLVGHSNTTPDVLNILTGSSGYSEIDHDDYGNLYVVRVGRSGKATVREGRY